MSDRPDTPEATVNPRSTSDERPTILDDSIAEERAIPLSVAVGEESPAAPGIVSEDQVKLALRRVKDPDLNLNILDMGLVYQIQVVGTKVKVDMTLTSPGCPSGPEIMTNAETEIKSLPGVEAVEMNLVWTPFWTPEKMEPRVRAYLGF
ncbi:MAG: metal-sulfur cluster assembly factor [Gemmatimonadales bacterium]